MAQSLRLASPPADPSEGGLWYDSTRLELFVFYTDPDGVGGWVPCSPLGARVEAGEIVQAQLVERVGELEKRDPELYVEKSGSVMTGSLQVRTPATRHKAPTSFRSKLTGWETGGCIPRDGRWRGQGRARHQPPIHGLV